MSGDNPLKYPDLTQNIKLFNLAQPNFIIWGIKYISNIKNKAITPLIAKKNTDPVYIPHNLIVGGHIFSNVGQSYTLSDERLKDNIKSLNDNDLFTLNPIIFSYKNDATQKKHFGLLAQDVEKIYPELVEPSHTGYKSINYQEFIPIMLSNMKKMQNEIDELKEKVF
jgi:hypothetical protein